MNRSQATASAAEALQNLEALVRRGEIETLVPLPSGLRPLDRYLDGGFHRGDLILLGGAPGVGKTTMALQMARNLAGQPQTSCAYICYEHSETFLLQRLIALECYLAQDTTANGALSLNDVHELIVQTARSSRNGSARDLFNTLQDHHASASAVDQLRSAGQRLHLMSGSGQKDGSAILRHVVRELKELHGDKVALVVDYLQKVPVYPMPVDEYERTTQTVSELKDLALIEEIPIVAVVAADREGLRAPRLRMHHLRGSSALAYEADVILILNNKFRIVAKKSIAYNPHQAQTLRQWVVCSVEKNRSGLSAIDLEFRSNFGNAAFDPMGGVVTDDLIDERIEE